MPESTCLHIQDREAGPIRVVELPWISVRIGRAAYCEVRLPDESVSQEVCRLTRRGRTWNLVPSSGTDEIFIQGRALDGACPLPFDVPFRMGPYWLTLRHDVTAEPDWELYPASIPTPAIETTSAKVAEPIVPNLERPEPPGNGSARSASDPDRWRARWKAAESHLKARASRLDSDGQRGVYPAPADPPKTPEIPTPRPRGSFEAKPAPAPRRSPIPTPQAVRPEWVAPRPHPSPEPQRPVPARPSMPIHETLRPEPTAFVPSGPVATPRPPERPKVDRPEPVVEPTRIETATTTAEPAAAFPEITENVEPSETLIAPELAPEPEPAPESETEPLSFRDTVAESPAEARSDEPDPQVGLASTASTSRRPERSPRRRKSRERVASGRRGEPSRRRIDEGETRDDPDSARHEIPVATGGELPSVRDILVNHRNSPGPHKTVERPGRGAQAIPTTPTEPGQWSVPGWLVLPPIGAFMLGTGLLSCVLSWWWAQDASTSSVVTQRLLAADPSARRAKLPPDLTPTGGGWIKGTSQHLAHWAIITAGAAGIDEGNRNAEASALVSRALEISPMNPTARLAKAQLQGAGRDDSGRIRGLGLSRDSVSLAWGARRLMDAGKKDAALRLYRRALSAAVEGGLSRSATPRFAEESRARRYFLPGEDAARDIVAELASREDLTFSEWSSALPRHTTVLLATARLLREQGRREADAILGDLLDDERTDVQPPAHDPRRIAARAEALCLEARWNEAADAYRQAIERVDNDLIRRSWWFNLADVADRLNDEGQRRSALRAVLAAHSSDDISRRVGKIQRSSDGRTRASRGFSAVKAN